LTSKAFDGILERAAADTRFTKIPQVAEVVMRKAVTLLVLIPLVTACARGGSGSPNAGDAAGTPSTNMSVAETGGIIGWVWDDVCDSTSPPVPADAAAPSGCVAEASPVGAFHGDGLPAQGHGGILGVAVDLGAGECPSTGLGEAITIPSDNSFAFTELLPGTYCVSIDPSRQPNDRILGSGMWTAPALKEGVSGATIRIGPGEFRSGVRFGWDYKFKP